MNRASSNLSVSQKLPTKHFKKLENEIVTKRSFVLLAFSIFAMLLFVILWYVRAEPPVVAWTISLVCLVLHFFGYQNKNDVNIGMFGYSHWNQFGK